MIFDLHMHSTFSDGEYTPTQLVELAVKQGVSVMALTDHDALEGLPEATAAAEAAGIRLIQGMEFSAEHSGELHILGYHIDPKDPGLNGMLDTLIRHRRQRTAKTMELLRQHGCPLEVSDIVPSSTGEFGRMNISKAMIAKGYVKNLSEAFDQYLRYGACCYVPGFKFSSEEIIRAIRAAGGIAVLAHPGQLHMDRETVTAFIENLVSLGLEGVEVYHPSHNNEDRAFYLSLCRRWDLIYTCGTDFHGPMRDPMMPGGTSADYRPDEKTLRKLGIDQ